MLDLLWYDGPAAVLAHPGPGVGEATAGPRAVPGPSGSAPATGVGEGPTAPATDDGDDATWARAVALGACARYAEAHALLAATTSSRASSTRASLLRQVGLHAEATPLDLTALATATTSADRADATSGLVADALGGGDAERALALLADARGAAATDGGWRSRTRLFWVIAELALLLGEARTAAADADEAVRTARAAGAPRHLTKSLLVRGVARHVQGDDGAVIDLLTALDRARAGGLTSLVWPAAAVAAEAAPARAAELLAVAGAACADVVTGLGERGPAFAARPDVARLLAAR